MSIYSHNLSDYNISFNNLSDTLVCILDYNNNIWKSSITINDLHSGMLTTTKLMNLIKLNSQKIQPNYSINIEFTENKITSVNYLIMNISYSNEFIEFDEKIYFHQTTTFDESKQLQIIQQQKIQISNLIEIITKLENKIDEIENNQYMNLFGYIMSEKFYFLTLKEQIEKSKINTHNNSLHYISINVPKNIEHITIEITSNKHNHVDGFGAMGMYQHTTMEVKIMIKNFSFMECDIGNNVIGQFNGSCEQDIQEIKITDALENFGSLLKFVNLKKMIIECSGNTYNEYIIKAIVKFLEINILKKNVKIESNSNQLYNEFIQKGYIIKIT